MKKIIKSWRALGLILVVFISLGFFNKAQAASNTWVPVGLAGFSAGSIGTPSLAFNPIKNQPYVAFQDQAHSNKVTVMRFDGSQWVNVGNAGFSAVISGIVSFAFNPLSGQPYVAYQEFIESSYKVTVMRFDGSQWVNVGNAGFSAVGGTWPGLSLVFNPSTNEPYVAYADNYSKLTVMRFDGSQWVNVGNAGFSPGQASFMNIAFNPSTNEPYVAYSNLPNDTITVMRFDGSQWINVGLAEFGHAFNSAGTVSFAFNPITNEPFVVYSQPYNSNRVTVMKFDGSQWVNVGNAGFAYGVSVTIALNSSNGQPYVAYSNMGQNRYKATVMKFDGSQWVNVGNAGFSAGNAWSSALTFNPATNEPYVAYMDSANSYRATVMRFDSNAIGASVINVSTRKSPDKVIYNAGEKLDLAGLVVTLGKTDGSSQDVPFANFAAYGITTIKSNGDPLVVNDKAIVITVNGHSNIVPITVNLNDRADLAQTVNTWDASKENLVVITHGWKGSANDDWVQDMGKDIYNNVDHSKTSIWLFDWKDGAATGDAGAPIAYANAGGDNHTNGWHGNGERLYQKILALDKANEMPNHIHLIAHSAGSNVIQTVVDRLAEDNHKGILNRVPSIHLTFLDSYVPWEWEQDRFGSFNNRHDDWTSLSGYAEQYVDTRLVSPSTLTDGTHTKFNNAVNFDVTSLDPNALNHESPGGHEWPFYFYDKSVANERYSTPYSNETFKLGFPFSKENINTNKAEQDNSHLGKWCVITNVFEPYRRCLDDKPEDIRNAILTDPTRAVTIYVPNGVTNYLVDVSQFISGGTGVLPKITIESSVGQVAIPEQTTVTSADSGWDGLITAPEATNVTWITNWKFIQAIEVGFSGDKLSFDKAVRIVLPGQKGRVAVYGRDGGSPTEITTICSADNQDAGNALISDGDCKMDVGSDLVIWTKHFTKFATYSQDNTSPTTTVALSGDGGPDWFKSDVQVTLTSTDDDGGFGLDKTEYSLDGGTNWTTYSAPFTISDDGSHEIKYRSTDKAGNVEDVKSVEIKIDKTAPEITMRTPVNGEKYVLNSAISADWSATDEGSGIDTASGTVASGNQIDTSSIGSKSFSVTATDLAGNSVTKTVSYDVIYDFGGFQDPATKDGKAFNSNSTVPVKFQLTDASGGYISTAIASLEVDGKNAVASGDSNSGNAFRYDESANQYVFNLSAKNSSLEVGTHTLKIILGDGTTYDQPIVIK